MKAVEKLATSAKEIHEAFERLRLPMKVLECFSASRSLGNPQPTGLRLPNTVIKHLLFPFSSQSESAPSIEPSPVVRQAHANDLMGLAEVLTESFHPSHGPWWWMSPVLKLGIHEDLRQRLRSHSPHYACLVASVVPSTAPKSEQVVGTVEIASRSTTWSASAQTLYISNLAVKDSYRRQGIAQSLLNKCDQLAQHWGFCKLSLHVLEDNYQARQLYTKSGYQLERVESSLGSWLFQQPRRLLLSKQVPLG